MPRYAISIVCRTATLNPSETIWWYMTPDPATANAVVAAIDAWCRQPNNIDPWRLHFGRKWNLPDWRWVLVARVLTTAYDDGNLYTKSLSQPFNIQGTA